MKLGRRWFLIQILCFSPLHTQTLLSFSQFVLLSKSQINNSRNPPSLLKFGFYRCLNNGFKTKTKNGLNYVFNFLFIVNYGFSALWLLLPLIFTFALSTPLQARISKNKAYFMSNKVWTRDPPLMRPKHYHYANSHLVLHSNQCKFTIPISYSYILSKINNKTINT